MIVPAIGIVIENDQRCVSPLGLALQEVGNPNHELLFVQRIGISWMAVLNCDGFEEAYLGEIARLDGRKEVLDVVFVIGRIARVTDRGDRVGTRVGGIRSGRVVLERSVMGNVIRLRTDDRRGRLAVAAGAAVGIYTAQVEASGKPAPGDAGGVEQVADILTAHLRLSPATRANVVEWIGIADDGHSAVPVAYQTTGAVDALSHAVGLAGN